MSSTSLSYLGPLYLRADKRYNFRVSFANVEAISAGSDRYRDSLQASRALCGVRALNY